MAATSVQWDRPAYREAPEGVKINLENARVSAWFPNEATVNFIIGGREYHGWMPDYAVNITEKWLKAFIVGDYSNGDWKIQIPDETIQSTQFLRVPKEDQNVVVVNGWW